MSVQSCSLDLLPTGITGPVPATVVVTPRTCRGVPRLWVGDGAGVPGTRPQVGGLQK